eukprot:TRINITY_DN1844_c0_g1_i1.p1 TRINITY_DN1844_c0_g1~~TRINITY_DN1844_c0_g1_i1.p1  ORF type:complete len:104 (-),score=28.49 TRINITY_DN1844_c0_g1_i1:199-483(-)
MKVSRIVGQSSQIRWMNIKLRHNIYETVMILELSLKPRIIESINNKIIHCCKMKLDQTKHKHLYRHGIMEKERIYRMLFPTVYRMMEDCIYHNI